MDSQLFSLWLLQLYFELKYEKKLQVLFQSDRYSLKLGILLIQVNNLGQHMRFSAYPFHS